MDSEQYQLTELKNSNGHSLDCHSDGEEHHHHRVSARAAARLRIAAVVVSWTSVIFSFSTGVAALVLGCLDKSEALFGYGLDATLDSFSSVAVLWRFYGDASDLYSERKERKACLVIGILFIFSGLLLTGKSLFSIITRVHESRAIVLYTAFALTTGVVSVVLAFVKVYLGYKLESEAMATDSIITFVGAAMSFAGVAGLELYVQDTHLWFMDSVFGIICGLFLFVFGVKVVYGILRKKDVNGHMPLQ
ncbi:transmembrane protein 163a-like [Babylonia areolata]|uniref:transmembrane protein 163a-like n=1 Tax=Babylonia areolata TaxID=304850 RepID=UPI003FD063D2